MKMCRDCIESMVMRKLMKEVVEDLPIDLDQNYKLPCPFCRQNYELIYDHTGWGEYLVEDFINLGQSISIIKVTKDYFMGEIATTRENLRSHHNFQLAQQRRRLTDEVLLPLTQILNVEYRRGRQHANARR